MEERVIAIANDYLEGLSLRSLALKYNVSHVTIKNTLEKKLPEIDGVLAEKVRRYTQSKKSENDKSINNSLTIERVLKAYKLLVEEDKTVREIAQILDSTEFTIYRDLTMRLPLLVETLPEQFPASMLLIVKTIISAHRRENGLGNRCLVSFSALNLKSEKDILAFMINSMLKFRLTFPTASYYFGIDPEKLKSDVKNNYPYLEKSFIYLNEYEKPNQTKSKTDFLFYYGSLLEALSKKDLVTFQTLLAQITDKDFQEVLLRRKKGQKTRPGDGRFVAQYQLKYSFSDAYMAYKLDMQISNYVQYTRRYRDYDEERRYENLMATLNASSGRRGL